MNRPNFYNNDTRYNNCCNNEQENNCCEERNHDSCCEAGPQGRQVRVVRILPEPVPIPLIWHPL